METSGSMADVRVRGCLLSTVTSDVSAKWKRGIEFTTCPPNSRLICREIKAHYWPSYIVTDKWSDIKRCLCNPATLSVSKSALRRDGAKRGWINATWAESQLLFISAAAQPRCPEPDSCPIYIPLRLWQGDFTLIMHLTIDSLEWEHHWQRAEKESNFI